MTFHPGVARKQTIRHLAYIAGGLAALLIVLSFVGRESVVNHPRSGELVFPNVLDELGPSPKIRITTADTAYTLVERDTGWGLAESGGYPVRADRMELLADSLRTLRWGDVKTRDPSKFDRIGLGAPDNDGSGALLEILSEAGGSLGALISGRKDENLYGRRPGDDAITFQLDGELPPLYTRQAWLDLDIVTIPAEVVQSVRLVRPDGESLYLAREAGAGPRAFRPAPPNQDDVLISRLAASGPALAITRFFPVDVKPADELSSAWVARHNTITHDALEVDVHAYIEPDGFYVTLRAVEAGDGANRAESINAKADGWAFKLPEYDWVEFAPDLSSIVRRTAQ